MSLCSEVNDSSDVDSHVSRTWSSYSTAATQHAFSTKWQPTNQWLLSYIPIFIIQTGLEKKLSSCRETMQYSTAFNMTLVENSAGAGVSQTSR